MKQKEETVVIPDAYEVIEQRKIDDVSSVSYVLRHKKSGAHLAVLSNDDSNKVFYIGFKTPPQDDCGVPHIIEHTLLCGSEKFPVKDPFVELVKGSLNTFLNAITYPDKTVYPIASCNEKDFANLMEVYLDAVFFPNITKKKEIFLQEGWHYELTDADAPLTVNGVVYNEMKGAYSSPEELLNSLICKSLFPDNAYGKDSGGDPEQILKLCYETYLAYYRGHYHPSNAYIYLYGDMDVRERLLWMDREYLCRFTARDVDSFIPMQKAFTENVSVEAFYPISSEEPEEKNSYLSYSKVIGCVTDVRLLTAFDILDYALVSAPGAPVKQALLDAGIGEDVYSIYDSQRQQPVFSIVAKGADASQKREFVSLIEEELNKAVREGIDSDSLLAGINSALFRFKEGDYGTYPSGLMLGLLCLDSWIFDEKHPFSQIELLDIYADLTERIDEGYFEELVQTYLLDNRHGAYAAVIPQRGILKARQKKQKQKLEEIKAALSPEETKNLVAQTAALHAYEQEPSPEEDLRKIKMLSREDLRREAKPYSNIEEEIDGVRVLRHQVPAHGILYLQFLFDAEDVPPQDLGLLSLLCSLLGYVDTENESYLSLSNALHIHTGGIDAGVGLYPSVRGDRELGVKLLCSVRVLEEKLPKALSLVQEVLLRSDFSDEKRIEEIIKECRSRLQDTLSVSGHMAAANRALAKGSSYACAQDALHGIAFERSLFEFEKEVSSDPDALIGRLKALLDKLIVRERLLLSFTADEQAFERAKPDLTQALSLLPSGEGVKGDAPSALAAAREALPDREGFFDASQILYVARAGNFVDHGYAYTGALRILNVMLCYDYMWIEIRVVGGAYGCMCQFMRNGETYFVSYRDPNLQKTNEVYEGIPDYLKNFDPDERTMTRLIIGAVSALDTPLYPEEEGTRSLNAYLVGMTNEMLQKERDEVLDAQPDSLRALADLVQAVLDDGQFCVIGNESAIAKEREMFDEIKPLYSP